MEKDHAPRPSRSLRAGFAPLFAPLACCALLPVPQSFTADGEGTATLGPDPQYSTGTDFNGNPSGNRRWEPQIRVTMPVNNLSGATAHYRWHIAGLSADNGFGFVYTTLDNISIIADNASANAWGRGTQIFRFVRAWDFPGQSAYPAAPVISTGQSVPIHAGVRAILRDQSNRIVFSKILTFQWTVTMDTDFGNNDYQVQATATLPAFTDLGSEYQEPAEYEVSFPDRTVPASGGTLQATVYCTIQNRPFTFEAIATPWLTPHNSGLGLATEPATHNGMPMFSGPAAFDAAAPLNFDYSQWCDVRQGRVTIQDRNFTVKQQSAGFRFERISTRRHSGKVWISYEMGHQASPNQVEFLYSVSGAAFEPIALDELHDGDGDAGPSVNPGSHTLSWLSLNSSEAWEKDLTIRLQVRDPLGYYAISDPFNLQDVCSPCEDCEEPLKVAASTGSVQISLPLGSGSPSRPAGQLWIHETTASDRLRTPACLWREISGDAQTLPTGAGDFSQVLTPSILAEIADPDPADNTWSIRGYDRATQLGPFVAASGLHDQSAQTPFQTVTFTVTDDLAGAVQSFTVDEAGSFGSRRHIFTWSPDAGAQPGWILDQIDPVHGLLRRETVLATTLPGGVTTRTDRKVFEPDGTLADRLITTTQQFPFGERTVQEEQFIIHPDGSSAGSRSTFHTYHSTEGQPGFGLLAETYTDFDGSWSAFSYGPDGVSEIRRTYRDAGRGSDPSELDVTSIAWETGEFGLGPALDLAKTVTRRLAGQAVSRTVEVIFRDSLTATLSDGQTPFACSERWSIELVNPAIATVAEALSSPDALVTKTRTYSEGPHRERVRSIQRPDGTITLFEYDGAETRTWTGAAAADGHAILAGTLQSELVNAHGHLVSSQTVALPGQLVIATELALSHDALGRPTQIQHLDGSTSSASYSCCGLESETDRAGITTTYVRDLLGRLRSQTRLGITTAFELTATGRLRSITESGGGITIVREATSADNAGVQVTRTTAGNRTTATVESRAANGARILTTTFPDGGMQVESFYLDGRLRSISGTAAFPRRLEYGPDPAGGTFLKEFRPGDQGEELEWTQTFLDFAGRVSRVVRSHESGVPAVAITVYNAGNQRVQSTDPDGVVTLYEFNALGEQTAVALDLDRNGAIDRAGIDRIVETAHAWTTRSGKTVRQTIERGFLTNGDATATILRITATAVDGLETWVTEAGLTTHTRTELHGDGGATVTLTFPDGSREVTGIAAGRPAHRTRLDSAGTQIGRTEFAHDSLGRLQTATDARNGATSYAWFDDGQIASVTTPPPAAGSPAQTTSFAYDAAGRLDTTALPDGGVVDRDYYPTGLLQRQSGARAFPIDHSYDVQGRLRTMTSAAGVTQWTYHPESGRLARKIHGDGLGPACSYTAAGRLAVRVSGRGITTSHAYDEAGDLAAVDHSDGTPDLAFTRTRRGQMAAVSHGGRTHLYTYSPAGRLEFETVSGGILDGLELDPAHDALLRRSSWRAKSASWEVATGYAYDGASRLHSVTSGGREVRYGYLPNSHNPGVTTHLTGGAAVLQTSRAWDKLDRLQVLSHQGSAPSGALQQSFSYLYDAASQRTRLTREDGGFWDYGYDGRGQLAMAREKLGNGTPRAGRQFEYAFDAIGNRTEARFGGDSAGEGLQLRSWAYRAGDGTQIGEVIDPGRVTISGKADPAASVTIDAQPARTRQGSWFEHELGLGNSTGAAEARIQVAATLDGTTESVERTAFAPPARAVFEYDEDGNLTFDGFLEYAWDAANRLTRVRTRPGLAPPGTVSRDFRQEMEYDHLGRRIRRTLFYRIAGQEHLASDIAFIYEGWNLAAEVDARTGALLRSYVWGLDLSGTPHGAGGVGGLLSITDVRAGLSHYAVSDGNGNVTALADALTGELTALYHYDPFGNLLGREGPAADRNPLRFSTKHYDEAPGLYDCGCRYYDPRHGRWLSRDPLAEAGGENLYGFVGNDPVNSVDPLGLDVYAIDGTWANVGGNKPKWTSTNVSDFIRRVRQADLENARYFPGPGVRTSNPGAVGKGFHGATGAETYLIARDVKNQICADYWRAKCERKEFKINLVGWSRGAVAAAWVAKLLGEKGCACNGRTDYPEVNFLGLYDAVEMIPNLRSMPGRLAPEFLPGDQGPPDALPGNVRSFFHAQKSGGNTGPGELIPMPTKSYGRGEEIQFSNQLSREASTPSTHGDIGVNPWITDAHAQMLAHALAAGVHLDATDPYQHLKRK